MIVELLSHYNLHSYDLLEVELCVSLTILIYLENFIRIILNI